MDSVRPVSSRQPTVSTGRCQSPNNPVTASSDKNHHDETKSGEGPMDDGNEQADEQDKAGHPRHSPGYIHDLFSF